MSGWLPHHFGAESLVEYCKALLMTSALIPTATRTAEETTDARFTGRNACVPASSLPDPGSEVAPTAAEPQPQTKAHSAQKITRAAQGT